MENFERRTLSFQKQARPISALAAMPATAQQGGAKSQQSEWRAASRASRAYGGDPRCNRASKGCSASPSPKFSRGNH